MKPVPPVIRYGKVLRYAIAGPDCSTTGNAKRFVDGTPLFLPAAFAVVHYELSQGGVYLFYCDRNWRVLKDNWHYSVPDAMERANHEFSGLRWDHPPSTKVPL